MLEGLETLDRWPEKVRTMQANWIGKSEGLQMRFQVGGSFSFGADKLPKYKPLAAQAVFDELRDKNIQTAQTICPSGIEIFTTRPDTLFGASFIALSPDHELAKELSKDNVEIEKFRQECAKIGTSEEAIANAPKLGIDTHLFVWHPFEEKLLPVWIANFVLMGYGTGAVFGCPAHDQRDLDFARKYNLDVTPVVLPEGKDSATYDVGDEAYTGEGTLFNLSLIHI